MICCTISLIIGVFGALDNNLIDKILNVLDQLPFLDPSIIQFMESVTGAMHGVQLAFILCGIVTIAGFWVIFWGAAHNTSEKAYRIGFTAIQVVKFNELIVSLFVLPWFTIRGYRLLDTVKSYLDSFGLHDYISQVSLLQTLLVITVAGFLFYLFDVLVVFSIMKDSACNSFANSHVSYYSPIWCFIISAAGLFIQLKTEFSMFVLLSCTGMILFGIFIFQYRRKMLQFE